MAEIKIKLPKCSVCGRTSTHGVATVYRRDNHALGAVEYKTKSWVYGCAAHPAKLVEIDLGGSINGAAPWPED